MLSLILDKLTWWLYDTLFKNDLFEKLKTSLKACFIHDRILINSLVFIKWAFIQWEQNYVATSTILNNDTTYLNVLIQNIWFKTKNTESTERRNTSSPKEILENAELYKPVLNKIMTT